MPTTALVHQLRQEISKAKKTADLVAEVVARGAGGREVSLLITKLEEAKMWGGKALGALGEQPPEGYAHDEAPVEAQGSAHANE